jgi:hypothetical protein
VANTENKTPHQGADIRILIATPTYSGDCYTGYTLSLMKTYSYFQQFKNIRLYHRFINYDCSIPRARNHFVAYALAEPTITHLLFIDADIRWEPEDVAKLLKHNKPIVAGVIPKKKYLWDRLRLPHMREIIMNNDLSLDEFKKRIKAGLVDYAAGVTSNPEMFSGLIEAQRVGTAFLLLQREVFEKMIKAFPERKIKNPPPEFPERAKDYLYSLFDQECKNGEYISSDYSFCRLWESIGGKVYADLTINIGHHGSEEFEGDFISIYGPKSPPKI